jgi:hypothetical protein
MVRGRTILGYNHFMRNFFQPINPHPSHEQEKLRLRRNFQELVQEVSAVLFSVQILFGFLFGMVFMPRFSEISPLLRKVHLVALILAALTLIFMIAPVTWHRFLMRRKRKDVLVWIGNKFFILGLFCLLASISCAIWLVIAVTWGGELASIVTTPIIVFSAAIWLILPLWLRYNAKSFNEWTDVRDTEI